MSQQANARLLAVVAALLTLNLGVQVVSLVQPSPALAQPRPSEGQSGFITTAEMVNRTNNLLTEISGRLSRIESALGRPIDVKVVSMPPVKIEGGLPTASPTPAPVVGEGGEGGEPARPATIRITPVGGGK
jgi:hypothetical protein